MMTHSLMTVIRRRGEYGPKVKRLETFRLKPLSFTAYRLPPTAYCLLLYWQPCSLKELMRVCQLKVPLVAMYWVVNHMVQSSMGSTLMVA